MTSKKEIKCPQCGRLSFYSPENVYRPFCSERCRLIDLGQWADGTYRVPLKPQDGYQDADVEGADDANSDLQSPEEE
jgi:endogenous inhibitor of DNA gyrase (YacG/DUF329 family)